VLVESVALAEDACGSADDGSRREGATGLPLPEESGQPDGQDGGGGVEEGRVGYRGGGAAQCQEGEHARAPAVVVQGDGVLQLDAVVGRLRRVLRPPHREAAATAEHAEIAGPRVDARALAEVALDREGDVGHRVGRGRAVRPAVAPGGRGPAPLRPGDAEVVRRAGGDHQPQRIDVRQARVQGSELVPQHLAGARVLLHAGQRTGRAGEQPPRCCPVAPRHGSQGAP